jgi:CRP-like cAMP-binding protein
MCAADQMRANAILAQLPDGEFDLLRQQAAIERAEVRHQVYRPGKPINDVYFPITAVFSLVAVVDDAQVEVATLGHEGMAGLPVFLGANSSPHAAFCQIAGDTVRVSADHLRRALTGGDGALHRALNRLTQATMVQIAQNVVCNSSHQLEQRAARWLLTTQDRVRSDEFPLTQQFLAQMLGARRPTVSQVARRLSGEGLIRYTRGVMQILDRPRLEAVSCQCYAIVKAQFDILTRDERDH